MRKPDFCLGENKGADQLRGNREADQRLCFRYSDSTIPTRIVQFLFYLNPKFQASSSFLSLYRPVCVGPGRKPRRPVFSRRGSFYTFCGNRGCGLMKKPVLFNFLYFGEVAIGLVQIVITKTCPCNIQRFFSTVKIEKFIRKFLIFFLFLLKT